MDRYRWVNKQEYPFASHYLQLPMGKLHYIDEGHGQPIVMVHGNPTWSFVYRHMIKCLSPHYRCVSMDHIGFGLSDNPPDWSYLPIEHAKNVAVLIDHLGLTNITLVVQDWGGPIGLSYAVNNPNKVQRLIIMNTWMWPVNDDPYFVKYSRLMGGPIGKFMIERFNIFANVMMKRLVADKSKLPPHIHQQYRRPLGNVIERKGNAVLPKEIIGSTNWLEQLWAKRENIAGKPALVIWGVKDIAFREKELSRWTELLRNCKVIRLDNVGHYVQEEMGPGLCSIVKDFLSSHKYSGN